VEAATPSYGIDAAAESDSGDSSERDPAPAA